MHLSKLVELDTVKSDFLTHVNYTSIFLNEAIKEPKSIRMSPPRCQRSDVRRKTGLQPQGMDGGGGGALWHCSYGVKSEGASLGA